MGNEYLYKPTTWQGLLQQIVFLVTQGYSYFHVAQYPENKRDKWDKIDKKLIEKYQTNLTRSQRYRNKEKRNANFWFLRYESVAIILMATTDFKGAKTQARPGIVIDDQFFDIHKKDMKINIGKMSSFKVHSIDGKITVSMTNQMFTDIKIKLLEVAKTKDLKKTQFEFHKLNGLPAWAGINKQKFQLLDLVVQELKRHNIKAKKTSFFVKLTRNKVKVYQ